MHVCACVCVCVCVWIQVTQYTPVQVRGSACTHIICVQECVYFTIAFTQSLKLFPDPLESWNQLVLNKRWLAAV